MVIEFFWQMSLGRAELMGFLMFSRIFSLFLDSLMEFLLESTFSFIFY